MWQDFGAVACTKPEQHRKYLQTGACPLLLLGMLPLSRERAQAVELEARGPASSQHLPRSYRPARLHGIRLLVLAAQTFARAQVCDQCNQELIKTDYGLKALKIQSTLLPQESVTEVHTHSG